MTHPHLTGKTASVTGAGRAALILAPLLVLAACGSKEPENTEVTINGKDVAIATAGAATGLVDTSDLPAFVEIYESGTPVMNMKSSDGPQSGGLLSYTVKAPIADVVAFHRASAKRSGITFKTEATTPDGMTLMGTNADETQTLMVIIASGEETTVSLTHSRKTG